MMRTAEELSAILPPIHGHSKWRDVSHDFATNGTDFNANRLIGFKPRLFSTGLFSWMLACDAPPYVIGGDNGKTNSRVGYTGVAWPATWPEPSSGKVAWCYSDIPVAVDLSALASLIESTAAMVPDKTRITRDEVGILVATAWALRGTCGRRKVGCLLVDAAGHTLSTGYNGPPKGDPHCTEHPCPGRHLPSGQGLDLCQAIHAEQNALMQCPDVDAIHTCYVTHSPCVHCVKMLMNTSCVRVVFATLYAHDDLARERWAAHHSGQVDPVWVHVPAALLVEKMHEAVYSG